jgi:hypothetical protein
LKCNSSQSPIFQGVRQLGIKKRRKAVSSTVVIGQRVFKSRVMLPSRKIPYRPDPTKVTFQKTFLLVFNNLIIKTNITA